MPPANEEKDTRYTVTEAVEEVMLGDEESTEKVLLLHRLTRTPSGKKVTTRVVARFFTRAAVERYMAAKGIPVEAVTFAKPEE